MTDSGDVRARLERQAAEILGQARAEAAAVLRVAQAEADEIVESARRDAGRATAAGSADRDDGRRELQKAQEHAIRIRSDAQRTADSILERAKRRARSEADEILRDARLQLARAVAEVNEAQRTAAVLRAASAEVVQAEDAVLDLRGAEPRLELVVARPPGADVEAEQQTAAVVPLRPRPSTPPMTPEEMKAWVSDLSDGTLDALIAGAVACAVERAISPTIVRAGRYTITQAAV
jgi:F0F1-type ATP synthase membrane subunit b/b'